MSRLPDHPNLGTLPELYAAYPEPFLKLGPLGHAVMRGDAPLTSAERELIAAYVSLLNSCAYCHGIHAETARQFGMDPDLLTALADDPETAPIPESLRPILAYVRVLTETPERATDAYTQAIVEAGWDDDAIVYAVAATAYFNMMNRLVEGFGLTLTDGYAEAAGARMAETGYLGVRDRAAESARGGEE